MRTKTHPLLRIAHKYVRVFDRQKVSTRQKSSLYRAGWRMFPGGSNYDYAVIFYKPSHNIPRETKEQILRILKQIPELKAGISTFTLAQILQCSQQTALMIMWWGHDLGFWRIQPAHCICSMRNRPPN